MSEEVATHGVPNSLVRKPGAGKIDVNVYQCMACGDIINGTERAVEHDACHLAPDCPSCGWPQARPTLGVGYERVDVCWACGMAFRTGGDA